ncbi:MAG: thiamine diphosphokinase [Bacilli bacterium]|nr:thiamine diphosphokinase [Bacilli bacterium]
MIIKIICASNDTFTRLYKHDDEEFLVGVDAGVDVLIKNRLPVDLAIGDFDSSKTKDIKTKVREMAVYPAHKSKSDLELAINYVFSPEFQQHLVLKRAVEKIIIYNSTGKRMDHYRATMNLLVRYTHLPIEVVDNHNFIYLVNSRTVFKKGKFRYISFFAVDPKTIVSLQGFKYDLTNYELGQYDNLCLSNEIVEKEAILMTNNKKILVIQSE